jgi:hypothetical protein
MVRRSALLVASPRMPELLNICFERIIPGNLDPQRSVERALRDQMVMNARGKVTAATLSYIARMAVANWKKWECRATLKCRFLVRSPGGNQSSCPERTSKGD